jgi:hypothetical protein
MLDEDQTLLPAAADPENSTLLALCRHNFLPVCPRSKRLRRVLLLTEATSKAMRGELISVEIGSVVAPTHSATHVARRRLTPAFSITTPAAVAAYSAFFRDRGFDRAT